jgi:hypothetical protein
MTTRQIAQGIAQLGRHGDSTLMHVTPHEVAGLQALAQTQGTSLTVNPQTGLPEAFNLGGFFKSLLPTVAGFAAAGMSGGTLSPMVAGILAGSATGALTNKNDPLMGAAMGGLGGYGGANLFGAAKGFAPTVAPGANTATTAGAAPSAVDQAVSQAGGVMDPLMKQQLSMFTPAGGTAQTAALGGPEATYGALSANTAPTANTFAPNFNPIPGAAQGTGGYQPPSLLASDTSNLQQAYSNVAADPTGFIGQNKMAIGMPVGMAALSGLEPSDLYGEQMRPGQNPNERYDPYRSLNLNTDTGLRLYAQGGPVSFADGGDTQKDPAGLPGGGLESLKGGDAGAMQGAGMLPLDVSDINAKFGISGQGGFIPVPKLGLFADNDQIESARTAYEAQLAAAMSGRGGMGSPYGFGGMGRGMTGMGTTGMNRMGGNGMVRGGVGSMGVDRMMGLPANTAPTARTAETSLSRLNLNKTYANGGTIQAGGLQDLYQTSDNPSMNPTLSRDGYGLGRLQAMADGGVAGYAKGGYLDGAGDGMSDSIPATIEGKQPARLADGEFVIPADVVSHLGNGSTKAGSKRLYAMLDKVRHARTGNKKQGKQINPNKYMPE